MTVATVVAVLRLLVVAVVALAVSWLVMILLAARLPAGLAKDLASFLPSCVTLLRTLRTDPRVPRRAKVAVGFAALWAISPIDLIPEVLPVIGPLDDIVVIALALRYAGRQVPRPVILEAWPGDPALLERLLGPPGPPPEAHCAQREATPSLEQVAGPSARLARATSRGVADDPDRKVTMMGTTGYPAFDATVQKTNQVLRDIEEAYGWPPERRQQSYTALRAVLHALRDRLPVAEVADLGAQLPMLLRGLYYEGWDPARAPLKMDRDEFLARVQDQVGFEVEGGIELLVRRVLEALRRYVSEGEWEDIVSVLPRDVAALIPS